MVTLEATKQSNQVDLNAMFGKAARVLGIVMRFNSYVKIVRSS